MSDHTDITHNPSKRFYERAQNALARVGECESISTHTFSLSNIAVLYGSLISYSQVNLYRYPIHTTGPFISPGQKGSRGSQLKGTYIIFIHPCVLFKSTLQQVSP